ncbi:hypothetical protein [Methylobacterium soli]|uniref:Uncharacterized protein n=1 Tax=Methylobacterium soli TaxID=553447 RepID=A0A6L3SRI6_9HYPH|nr:hypothetical protein [Methylobacterium soli]KAB1073551.1 hypothetical protein F6X53_26985 [Methylobacterium soli]GJE44092.1 hypothetical protein AEGHOMDF_3278 [Methylobacterium soli]
MIVLPPWREVTTDDYHSRNFPETTIGSAFIAQTAAAHALIRGQHAGEHRIRLVLRVAVDLKPSKRSNPFWVFDYLVGSDDMRTCAEEVVIEFRNGRRELVPIYKTAETASLKGGGWAGGVVRR